MLSMDMEAYLSATPKIAEVDCPAGCTAARSERMSSANCLVSLLLAAPLCSLMTSQSSEYASWMALTTSGTSPVCVLSGSRSCSTWLSGQLLAK